MTKVLVITVGMNEDGVAKAVDLQKPDKVIFLCSNDGPGVKGTFRHAERVAERLRLSSEDYTIIKVRDFESPDAVYESAVLEMKSISEKYSDCVFTVHYTFGTKAMGVGLVFAGMEFDNVEIATVVGKRDEVGNVLNGTEIPVLRSFDGVRYRNALKVVNILMGRFDYRGGIKIVDELPGVIKDEKKLRNLGDVKAILMGLDAWDRIEYLMALKYLEPFGKYYGKYLAFLKKLLRPRDERVKGYLVVLDLLENARRRGKAGRYDDAVGRIYRAIELAAQVRLREEYGVDTSDVDLEKLPGKAREFVESTIGRSRDGKRKVALFNAYLLLKEGFADRPVSQWLEKNEEFMFNFLNVRNSSLLAHGTEPVGEKIFNEVALKMMSRLEDLLRKFGVKDKHPGLPTSLPEELMSH